MAGEPASHLSLKCEFPLKIFCQSPKPASARLSLSRMQSQLAQIRKEISFLVRTFFPAETELSKCVLDAAPFPKRLTERLRQSEVPLSQLPALAQPIRSKLAAIRGHLRASSQSGEASELLAATEQTFLQSTALCRKYASAAGGQSASTSQQIQSSLQSLLSVIDAEVERSHSTVRKLDGSSKLLGAVGNEVSAFRSLLVRSQEIVRDLTRKDRSDRWLVGGSFLVFIFAVLYVLRRRLLFFI